MSSDYLHLITQLWDTGDQVKSYANHLAKTSPSTAWGHFSFNKWKRPLTKQSQNFTSKLVLGTNVEMNGWKYGEYESFVEVLFFDREGFIFLFDPERSSDQCSSAYLSNYIHWLLLSPQASGLGNLTSAYLIKSALRCKFPEPETYYWHFQCISFKPAPAPDFTTSFSHLKQLKEIGFCPTGIFNAHARSSGNLGEF